MRACGSGSRPPVGLLRKSEIAFELIDALTTDDVPRAPVIADSAYGDATVFRTTLALHGSCLTPTELAPRTKRRGAFAASWTLFLWWVV